MTTTTDTKPRIYVACLAAYNSGILHGAWIDVTQGAWGIWDDVRAMLAASPIAGAEEHAIHDYEGFEGASRRAALAGAPEPVCMAGIPSALRLGYCASRDQHWAARIPVRCLQSLDPSMLIGPASSNPRHDAA